jgi:hypothetical protein
MNLKKKLFLIKRIEKSIIFCHFQVLDKLLFCSREHFFFCTIVHFFLELSFGPNSSSQNRLVRWRLPLAYKHLSGPSHKRCETLNTPPHVQHYWACCADIIDGWPDSGNLISGGPIAEIWYQVAQRIVERL